LFGSHRIDDKDDEGIKALRSITACAQERKVSERSMEQEHRYKAFETRNGFLIDGGAGRVPLRVTHDGTCWLLECGTEQMRFGLYQVMALADAAAARAMAGWQRRPDSRAPDHVLRGWACRQTARAMAYLVADQARRLLPRTDPTVLAVQRAIFAATFGAGALAVDESFYRVADRYVIADICRYRAAAVAARNLGEPWGPCRFDRHDPHCRRGRPDCTCAISTTRAAEHLENWRGLFSPTGRPYTSLNRTLMNLPGGVSHHLICNLGCITLERPVTDRVELTVLALSADHPRTANQVVFHRADRRQVETALRRVAAAIRSPLTSRRTRDLRTLVGFLADYPERHDGNLGGLADRAIRWHRDAHRRDVEELVAEYGGDHPVALPPIPLPNHPDLRFLSRISEICLEGREMRHCIASYAGRALAGECFLFHVEHQDQVASVEVAPCGRVLQAYGPGDCRNSAARWGERVLREWGRGFPTPAAMIDGAKEENPGNCDVPF